MTKLDDNTRLQHILDAAKQAQTFMRGRNRENLDTDPMLLLAIVKAIGIIGEAAARVSPEPQAAISQLPWLQMVSGTEL